MKLYIVAEEESMSTFKTMAFLRSLNVREA